MFSIEFVNEKLIAEEIKENSAYVKIVIGDFEEKFLASMSYWNKGRYLQQWKEGIKRILAGKKESCLIACMYNPKNANFINIWPIYLNNGKIVFRNNLLFMDKLKKPFDENNPYDNIPKREIVSKGGSPISEWIVDRVELEASMG